MFSRIICIWTCWWNLDESYLHTHNREGYQSKVTTESIGKLITFPPYPQAHARKKICFDWLVWKRMQIRPPSLNIGWSLIRFPSPAILSYCISLSCCYFFSLWNLGLVPTNYKLPSPVWTCARRSHRGQTAGRSANRSNGRIVGQRQIVLREARLSLDPVAIEKAWKRGMNVEEPLDWDRNSRLVL